MARIQPYTWHDFTKSAIPLRHCDDIVDDTDFKKTLQKDRDFALTEGNAAVQGVFDYPDGKVDAKNTPTAFELSLRSGELDKADVSTVERALNATAKSEAETSAKKAKTDKAQKVAEARQAHLDSQVGFDSKSVTE